VAGASMGRDLELPHRCVVGARSRRIGDAAGERRCDRLRVRGSGPRREPHAGRPVPGRPGRNGSGAADRDPVPDGVQPAWSRTARASRSRGRRPRSARGRSGSWTRPAGGPSGSPLASTRAIPPGRRTGGGSRSRRFDQRGGPNIVTMRASDGSGQRRITSWESGSRSPRGPRTGRRSRSPVGSSGVTWATSGDRPRHAASPARVTVRSRFDLEASCVRRTPLDDSLRKRAADNARG